MYNMKIKFSVSFFGLTRYISCNAVCEINRLCMVIWYSCCWSSRKWQRKWKCKVGTWEIPYYEHKLWTGVHYWKEGVQTLRFSILQSGQPLIFLFFFLSFFFTENRESLLDAVKSILAGNPFIYHKKLIDLNLNNYFTKIKEKNHPFSSLASANIFMVSII